MTIVNLSAAAGRTIIGFVADRIGPVNALFFVIIMSGLSQLLVWTFVTTYGGIVSLLFSSPTIRIPHRIGHMHPSTSLLSFLIFLTPYTSHTRLPSLFSTGFSVVLLSPSPRLSPPVYTVRAGSQDYLGCCFSSTYQASFSVHDVFTRC